MELVIKNNYNIKRKYEDGTTTYHVGIYLGTDSASGKHVFICKNTDNSTYYISVEKEELENKTVEIKAA